MRKAYISKRTIIGILIGLFSLCIILVNGYRFIVYKPFQPLNLSDVTERDLKSGSYIYGEITDCFKVSHTTTTGWIIYTGNDAALFDGVHSFCSYTIPIAKDHYIRIWLQEGKEAQKSIEDILQGKASVVSFTGQIKKSTIAINKEFYDNDPNFDQTKIISEISIWEKGTVSERNYIFLGLIGMFFAWWVYRSDGGIIVRELENAEPKADRSYNQKNELDLATKLLERYRAEEKINRKKFSLQTLQTRINEQEEIINKLQIF